MMDFGYEQVLLNQGYDLVAGVDEAGRGPLVGPVVASCVVLKSDFKIKLGKNINKIRDCKKILPKTRELLFEQINPNAFIGIGVVNEGIIDRINILNATILCMKQAIFKLLKFFDKKRGQKIYFLIDGPQSLSLNIPHKYSNIVGADDNILSVACASIMAKVTRDRIMRTYNKIYPGYRFDLHKGYGTSRHLESLLQLGPSPIHRQSFRFKKLGRT